MARGIEDEGYRRITARWTITFDLTTTSASQIGSHPADNCDTTLGRDERGRPVLHGSTLAGALREALRSRVHGDRHGGADDRLVRQMFGDLSEGQSALVCYDTAADPRGFAIRDGVRVDPNTGTAVDTAKYDREIALPGLSFPARLDLLTPDHDSERDLVSALASILDDGRRDGFALGARRSRGLGRCEFAQFRAVRYDMESTEGWLTFANSQYGCAPLDGVAPCESACAALQRAWPELERVLAPGTPARDHRLLARLSVNIDGTVLVGSPGTGPGDPDKSHITEGGVAVLPGTSIAGLFRMQAGRILTTMGIEPGPIIDDLFGRMPDQDGSAPPVGSRARFSEACIVASRSYRQSRVKIDRFTAGAVDAALFDEQPAVGGELAVELEVVRPSRRDAGLLALVARDLLDGIATVGGGGAVGRGLLSGSANIRLPVSCGVEEVTIEHGAIASDDPAVPAVWVHAVCDGEGEPQ